MSRTITTSLLLLSALVLGCGLDPNAPVDDDDGSSNASGGAGEGSDPVSACEELEDTLAACVSSLEGTLNCSYYADTVCDLEDYFECINGAYGSCSDGYFPNVDAAALQDCALLASC
ncbi:hypothetical protein G6O69_09295 [Pseudenhygromyxa sp. WMMC2535]|uniref:hypothetical protein n=1 Tax=Pseudenhygromyxa sp. WMMC2535 TaxID=2712867 RepID=UPI00155450F0|nr:hypothetical protein [Pseudenhygromyxa sp. WMMC2535]NVB38026.1 hypothetical protein [Pseudenhygromyxa sp. WMMC2535]